MKSGARCQQENRCVKLCRPHPSEQHGEEEEQCEAGVGQRNPVEEDLAPGLGYGGNRRFMRRFRRVARHLMVFRHRQDGCSGVGLARGSDDVSLHIACRRGGNRFSQAWAVVLERVQLSPLQPDLDADSDIQKSTRDTGNPVSAGISWGSQLS